MIIDTFPVNGAVVSTKMFRATISDLNVADDLYVLWIADFPPFSANSRLIRSDDKPHTPAATTPQIVDTVVAIDCLTSNLALGLTQHQIMVAIADRPFLPPSDQTSLDRKYTTLSDPRALRAEAHWTLNLECK